MSKQGYISKSLEGLEFGLIAKHGLVPYVDRTEQTIFFGMYRWEDFHAFLHHKGRKLIVFFGSDALDLPDEWTDDLKGVEIAANSERVKQTLESKGIEVQRLIPVNPTLSEQWQCVPKGDNVYWYGGNAPEFYGLQIIEEIKERLPGIQFQTTMHGEFNQAELKDIYADCFLNLRLTPHDGCPNTNLQMGLMGRRSVFNGDLPESIKWDPSDIEGLCQIIKTEYDNRKEDNLYIATQFQEFNKKSYDL